jgi:hypothetical protein
MSKQKIVIFMHIPKTAGTTLGTIIEQNYSPFNIQKTYSANDAPFAYIKEISTKKKRHLEVVSGHFAFGVHELLPKEPIYITVLRKPIERTISEFYHINRDPNHGLYTLVSSSQMGLIDYLSHLRLVFKDNTQTRMFSGDWASGQRLPCSDEMLEQAKANLRDHVAVVGLTERFDETLLLVKKLLNWQNIRYQKRNVTQNRPAQQQLTSEEVEALQNSNTYDLKLYEYAQTLFEQKVAIQGASFQEEVEQMKRLNALPAQPPSILERIRRFSVRHQARKLSTMWERND